MTKSDKPPSRHGLVRCVGVVATNQDIFQQFAGCEYYLATRLITIVGALAPDVISKTDLYTSRLLMVKHAGTYKAMAADIV